MLPSDVGHRRSDPGPAVHRRGAGRPRLPPENPSGWRGFELLADRSDGLRERLAALTGQPARFTWFLRMDPQIAEAYGDPGWVARRYQGALEGLRERGEALGVHPHAWRWDRDRRMWFADHADRSWVSRCVDMSFATFADRFGTPPAHHRFGSRYVSEAVLGAGRAARSLRRPDAGARRAFRGARPSPRWSVDRRDPGPNRCPPDAVPARSGRLPAPECGRPGRAVGDPAQFGDVHPPTAAAPPDRRPAGPSRTDGPRAGLPPPRAGSRPWWEAPLTERWRCGRTGEPPMPSGRRHSRAWTSSTALTWPSRSAALRRMGLSPA
jgi:hypothetical protein